MNGKSIPELARRLKREGIATGKITGSRLPMLPDGREFHLGRGYQLVTWQRSPNRTTVAHGHKSRTPKQRRLEPTPPCPKQAKKIRRKFDCRFSYEVRLFASEGKGGNQPQFSGDIIA